MAVAEELEVSAFLRQQPKRHFIAGKWVESASGKVFSTLDPSTGEVLAEVAAGDAEDINRAVEAARRSFERGLWRDLPAQERQKILWRVADRIEERLQEFAQLEMLDGGHVMTQAMMLDVPMAVETFRYYAGWATKLAGETLPVSFVPGTRFDYTLRQPVGVVGQITPWNFPLVMAAWKLAPALATGCSVVLKPAEQTPLAALLLAEVLQECDLPPGVVNVVNGFGETAGAALASHPDVDKVAFTGSTEVGRLIVHASEGNLKRVSLELGGKSPNIVFADADRERAASGAFFAITFTQGQICSAGSRLFVQDKIYDQVLEDVSRIAADIQVGPALDPMSQMGPLISREHLDRVSGYVELGRSEGARLVAGGGAPAGGNGGYFLQPTVFTDVHGDMRIAQEEIFGPVLATIPFKDEADLVAKANDTAFGLAAGLWTNDVKRAHRVAHALRAGTVWINCYHAFDPAAPWGGFKQSGWGRELGPHALDLYTEVKNVVVDLT